MLFETCLWCYYRHIVMMELCRLTSTVIPVPLYVDTLTHTSVISLNSLKTHFLLTRLKKQLELKIHNSSINTSPSQLATLVSSLTNISLFRIRSSPSPHHVTITSVSFVEFVHTSIPKLHLLLPLPSSTHKSLLLQFCLLQPRALNLN